MEKGKPSIGFLLVVYVSVMLLLGLTVWVAGMGLGPLALLVALGIAAAKAILILLYFMHIRFSSRTTWIFAGAGVFWLLILFALTFSDYLSRRWLARAEPLGARVFNHEGAKTRRREGGEGGGEVALTRKRGDFGGGLKI